MGTWQVDMSVGHPDSVTGVGAAETLLAAMVSTWSPWPGAWCIHR